MFLVGDSSEVKNGLLGASNHNQITMCLHYTRLDAFPRSTFHTHTLSHSVQVQYIYNKQEKIVTLKEEGRKKNRKFRTDWKGQTRFSYFGVWLASLHKSRSHSNTHTQMNLPKERENCGKCWEVVKIGMILVFRLLGEKKRKRKIKIFFGTRKFLPERIAISKERGWKIELLLVILEKRSFDWVITRGATDVCEGNLFALYF